ncbi:SLC26A/SulP transporter family protein [bacterium]|nr:SLC26A/SulP transporter family protein [bacterium]
MGFEKNRKDLGKEDQPFLERILLGLTAGIVVGLITIILEISLASLLFSGELSSFLTRGIGFLLFGTIVVLVIASLTSRFAGVIVTPEDTPIVLLTLVVAGISVSMPATASPDDLFITVVASIVITSILVGLAFLLMGTFKLGKLIRYVPAPVIGGFLTGIGWLLVLGSLEVMTDTSFGAGNISVLFAPEMIARWVPGSVFAVILLLGMRRFKHFLLMPAMIVSGIGVFFLILWLTGSTLSEAGSKGWLLGPFPQERLWEFISISDLENVKWNSIWGQLGNIGIIALVSTFSLLLNVSGLELITHRDIELNHELKVAGVANIISSFVGSPPSFHTLSFSALSEKMGARTRSTGLFAAMMCGLVLIFGTSLLSFFPKPLVGGMLMFLGVSLLVEWLYDGWFRLSKIDYALIVTILLAVCTIGFMEGVGVGIFIAVVLFITSYSRISVIRQALTGTALRSNVDRPADERKHLREWGDELHILQLQGFIFFGTAHALFQKVKERVDDQSLRALRFIVFDLRRVIGLDGSAEIAFIKIIYLAQENDIELVFTDISDHFRNQIKRATLQISDQVKIGFFPDLDHGIEWCEEQMLIHGDVKSSEKSQPLQDILQAIFEDSSQIERMMTYLEREETDTDNLVIRQGEAAEHLYIIESGEFAAQLELPGKEPVRLRTMRTGAVFGEIGMYLDIPRSVSVVSTGLGSFYRLSSDSLKEMEKADPDLALNFQNYMIRILSERLVDLNRTLESLLD